MNRKENTEMENKQPTVHLIPTALVLLDYMREHGSITGIEAVHECGVMDYRRRMTDLRNAGFNIVGIMETGVNRRGAVIHYKRYSIEEAQA